MTIDREHPVAPGGDGEAGRTDRELLRAYAETKAQDAIAALVARHGTMVYAVCRRLLGDGPDAEDAAQATFILFSRKASALPADTVVVRGWLYRAARLAAQDARRQRHVRWKHEREAVRRKAMEDRGGAPDAVEGELDEALASLPSALRDAVVLRHLGGLSEAETAAELACSVGTASMRIARGIERLRRHFVRRGAVLTTAALAGLLDRAQAAMPAEAAARTVAACAEPATVGSSVLSIVKGVEMTLFWSKVKLAAACALGAASAAALAVAAAAPGKKDAGVAGRDVAPAREAKRGKVEAPPEGFEAPFPLRWDLQPIAPRDNTDYRLYRIALAPEGSGEPMAILANGRGNALDRAYVQIQGLYTEQYVSEHKVDPNTGTLAFTVPLLTGYRGLEGTGHVSGMTLRVESTLRGGAVDGAFTLAGGTGAAVKGRATGRVETHAELAAKNTVRSDLAWPRWDGPAGGMAATKSGQALVDDITQARLVWFSEENTWYGRESGDASDAAPAPKAFHLSGTYSSPVVAGGRVYHYYYLPRGDTYHDEYVKMTRLGPKARQKWAMATDDVVACLDAATGATIWRQIMPGRGLNWHFGNKHATVNMTPCVDGKRLYAVGAGGWAYGLDAATGKLLWESKIPGLFEMMEKGRKGEGVKYGFTNYFIAAEGVALLAGDGVVAFDGETGAVLWKRAGIANTWSAEGRTWLLVGEKDQLHCLDPRSGKPAWSSPVEASVDGLFPLTVSGPYVLLPAPSGPASKNSPRGVVCYRLSPRGAELAWKGDPSLLFPPLLYSAMAADDGLAYLRPPKTDKTASTGSLICLELATGRIAARRDDLPRSVSAALAFVAEGRVFSDQDRNHGTASQRLLMLDARTLQSIGPRWERPPHPTSSGYDIPQTMPVVDGRWFTRGMGATFCFDLRRAKTP